MKKLEFVATREQYSELEGLAYWNANLSALKGARPRQRPRPRPLRQSHLPDFRSTGPARRSLLGPKFGPGGRRRLAPVSLVWGLQTAGEKGHCASVIGHFSRAAP